MLNVTKIIFKRNTVCDIDIIKCYKYKIKKYNNIQNNEIQYKIKYNWVEVWNFVTFINDIFSHLFTIHISIYIPKSSVIYN